MFCAFFGCSSLTSLDINHFNTSSVSTMAAMFYGCSSLKSLDLSRWDTSKLTNIGEMFVRCSSLTSLDLSGWDTSKINQTTYSFDHCYRLNTLKWNNWKASLMLSQTALTQESTKDIVSKLATIDNSQTLTLGSTLLSYLSEEEIAAATSKGWTLA